MFDSFVSKDSGHNRFFLFISSIYLSYLFLFLFLFLSPFSYFFLCSSFLFTFSLSLLKSLFFLIDTVLGSRAGQRCSVLSRSDRLICMGRLAQTYGSKEDDENVHTGDSFPKMLM